MSFTPVCLQVVVERLQLLCPSAAGIFKKEEEESRVNEIFPKMQIREKGGNPSVPEARTRLREASQASQPASRGAERRSSQPACSVRTAL